MQLWRPKSVLDGINSGSWYHCLPIGIHHWLGEGGCIAVVCKVVRINTKVRRGLSGKKNEVALQRAEVRMVRWMCNVKVKDRVRSKELRERLGTDDIILILQQNRLRWYGHVLWKETVIGWRSVWNMRWRAPDQEVDQRGHAERLCRKIAKHVILLWIVVDGRSW